MSIEQAAPPVYVTIVSHNEEPDWTHPDYLRNRDFYIENRRRVRELALMLKRKGATLNFQSDWNYLKAVARYDVGPVTRDTNDKNIVRWLVEDLGFKADPHAHETEYNYADVARLHSDLGVEPSRIVGGFLSHPPDNYQGWEQHMEGIHGWKYPDISWKPDILWGAAVLSHAGPEVQTSYGVWRPKDRYHFIEHDPDQRLVFIGGGCLPLAIEERGSFYGVQKILSAISRDAVPSDGFYTVNPFVPQALIDDELMNRLADAIDAVEPLVREGRLIWSHLDETVETWKQDYGGRPFRLACQDVP